MTGLEIIVGGLLQLAAGGLCSNTKTPQITIQPANSVVNYDFSKSREALQNFEIDTVSPYEPGQQAKVGGLMSGEIQVESQIRFMQEKYPARGAACVYVDGVTIKFRVDPTIYVAREYPKGTCQHTAIIEHERKHVQTDLAVARKYANSLRDDIQQHIRRNGYSRGPVPIEKMAQAQSQLQDDIQVLIRASSQAMTDERVALQQKLDSLDEYERVAAQCRGQRVTDSAPSASDNAGFSGRSVDMGDQGNERTVGRSAPSRARSAISPYDNSRTAPVRSQLNQ